jgi:hypothetical protein
MTRGSAPSNSVVKAEATPAAVSPEAGPSARLPLRPKHPERTCWGCNRFCPADDLGCGNGTIRAPHPVELLGDDWVEWCAARESKRLRSADDSSDSPGPGPDSALPPGRS